MKVYPDGDIAIEVIVVFDDGCSVGATSMKCKAGLRQATSQLQYLGSRMPVGNGGPPL
jgi:hypothetical protein